jgi:hypothetical protein
MTAFQDPTLFLRASLWDVPDADLARAAWSEEHVLTPTADLIRAEIAARAAVAVAQPLEVAR